MNQHALAAPYPSSRAHLLDEIERIDVLVRAAVARARQVAGDDAFRGLTISESDVDALLHRSIGQPHWFSAPSSPDVDDAVVRKRADIDDRVRASRETGVSLRLDKLAQRFGLSAWDVDALLIALLPELDTRYERLFGYLHDDVTQKQPRVDVVLGMLCPSLEERFSARARFGANAPLIRHGLIHLFSPNARQTTPLLSCALKVDERIIDYLHESNEVDAALVPYVEKGIPQQLFDDLLLSPERKASWAKLLDPSMSAHLVIYLEAPPGHGKQTLAGATALALGKTLLVVHGERITAAPVDVALSLLRKVLREVHLLDAVVLWDHYDALLSDAHATLRRTLLDAVIALPGPTFLAGEVPWEPTDALAPGRFVRLEMGTLDSTDQVTLWKMALGGDAGIEETLDLEGLARRYRLGGGLIRDAAASARSAAFMRNPEAPRVTMADLSAACRFHANRHMSTLARKVEATSTWDDLVLAKDRLERLREMCNHARYRDVVLDTWGFQRKLTSGKGLSLMFSGPPGTGKTMTAGVMARELDLDLYQIDLSSVVSKYIGETEKHLARVFLEAERSRAILFFDEADALFGKRTEIKDAHDRFANIETSYLLQRIEAYEGIVVLATNFSRNIDEAFVRRIQFIIEFSLPDEKERRAIWERIWPAGVPQAPDLDFAFMARRFELAGAHIRNIALAAAFLAASDGSVVTQKHLLHATRREYQKMGKVMEDSQFAYRP